MDFLDVFHRRQISGRCRNEGLFCDHSVQLQIESLRCRLTDEFLCLACRDFGSLHYEVPPFVCKFTSVQDQEFVLAVADEEGIISLVDTSGIREEGVMIRFHAHNNAVFDLCWMEGEKKFVTVSGDQTAILWDVYKQTEISVFKGHTGSVKSVDFRPGDNAVFATGARDGNIHIWDTRSQKRGSYNQVDNILRSVHATNLPCSNACTAKHRRTNSISNDSVQSVTAVIFQDEHTLISAGAGDGKIKVWDLRRNYEVYHNNPIPKYTFPYPGQAKKCGYTNLFLNSSGGRLFASCTDHVMYQFNSASYKPEPVSAYFGHECYTFFVKSTLSPDEKYILGGSSDKNGYIWKVDCPGLPFYRLSGHAAEVTCVAWCKDNYDSIKLVTCSDDSKFKVWRVACDDDENHFCGKCELISPASDLNGNSSLHMSRDKLSRFSELILNKSSYRSPVLTKRRECESPILTSPFHPQLSTSPPSSHLLTSTDLITPKTLKTPSTLDHRLMLSPRKAERSSRTLPGKCLFTDAENSGSPPRKRQKEVSSKNRSPLANITRNNVTGGAFSSPTQNLPNSVIDKRNSPAVSKAACASPKCDHWLAQLGNAKKSSKSPNSSRSQKKQKTRRANEHITKYFVSVPRDVQQGSPISLAL